MKLSACTISFRHQLISLDEIATWAKTRAFHGVELWGVHALNLREFPHYNAQWLVEHNLKVSMISDYLPLGGDETVAIKKMATFCQLANFWGAKKIRSFAGDKASSKVSGDERKAWVGRLRKLCDIAAASGCYLVIETHPYTLADTLESTQSLISEVNHSHLKINFDVIHVWEAGDDPRAAFLSLAPNIEHMHLKNIRDHSLLDVFKPANVYAPAGMRDGMVGVFDGAFDFNDFLQFVIQQKRVDWQTLDVSLEWFGGDVLHTLDMDQQAIRALQGRFMMPERELSKPDAVAV